MESPLCGFAAGFAGGDGEYRGRDGPLTITDTPERGRLYDGLIAAAGAHGIEPAADYNGAVAKRQQVKPVQSAARPTRPGNASNVSQKGSAVKKSQQRLRQTGNVKDAASLIEKFL